MILQTQSLYLSAGHSHADPGAGAHGFTEADIVLDLRDRIADYLRNRVVFDTDGKEGENLPLSEAVAAAKTHDVALELHVNASSPAATGVETLSHAEHYEFGGRLCEAVEGVLGIANRGAKPEDAGPHSRLAFVSDGGGVILELFFITNPDDLGRYRADKDAVAEAIALVLIDEVCKPRA